MKQIVQYLDVCVDGEFQADKADTSLRWKGSSNQRVINVPATLREGKIVLTLCKLSKLKLQIKSKIPVI